MMDKQILRWGAAPVGVYVLIGSLIAVMPWFGAIATSLVLGVCLVIVLCAGATTDPIERRRLLRWSLVSLALHVLLGMLIANTELLYRFGPDALDYHSDGLRLAQSWQGLRSAPELSPGKEGFAYLLAGLYWSLGPYKEIGLVVNAAMGAALIPTCWRMTHMLFGRAARFTPVLVTFLPAFLIWPSQLLREASILLLISVAATAALKLSRSPSWSAAATLALTLVLLLTFRSSVSLVLAGGLFVGLGLSARGVVRGTGIQITAGAFVAMLVFGLGFGYSGFQQARTTDLADVEAYRAATSETASSGFQAESEGSETPITVLPIGMVRVLAGPFPWELTSSSQWPGLVDAAVWVILLPVLVLGLREGYRMVGRRMLVLLAPAFALTALLALVTGNYGLLLRERAQVMILLIPFFSFGLFVRKAGGRSAARAAQRSARTQEPESLDSGVGSVQVPSRNKKM